MTKILFIIFFLTLSVLLADGLIYAEHECTRTIACSDGTLIINKSCSSSYTIIDGRIVNGNSEDPDGLGHGQDNDDDVDDPCLGHGHRIDNESNESNGSDGSDDPWGLHGSNQAGSEEVANQSE
jgi:hypothetical protein